MLHPKNNRIDYGEQLIPPDGYELARAIGTTYSLDLEAIMILPVALFYAQKLDGNSDDLRYDMLDAITKAADKITVYYQNGQLKVPQKYHHLMAYWEKGIVPVNMPDHLSSFHPKVWVIRYERKDLPHKYRVLVTSRNLTFARDWDIAFATEGVVTDKEQPKNKPLLHFIQHLVNIDKKNISVSFLKDLLTVKFDLPDKFESLKFIPIGIANPVSVKSYSNPITGSKAAWDEMLIVSPFVDSTTLSKIYNYTNTSPYLLSRKEELDCVELGMINNYNCWQFSAFFEKAEYMQELEDDGLAPLPQNLHAKLFVAMQQEFPYWYLGSANCSDPAQERNIEFMVELKGKNIPGLKTKDVFKMLTNPAKTDDVILFTKYDPEARVSIEEKKQIDLTIRKIKYDLTKLKLEGLANRIEGGTAYDLAINVDATLLSLPSGYSVLIKPLPENQKAPVKIKLGEINRIEKFGGYAETALSIYLIFIIAKDENPYAQFLLPMEIELPASRLTKIFTAIIDSREKFLKYLTFLLTGEDTDLIKNTNKEMERPSGQGSGNHSFTGTPVYEKLLIASSRFPEKLRSIDALIQRLKQEASDTEEPIITAEFEGFWNVFQTFMKNKGS
jgi:hypothetical protein